MRRDTDVDCFYLHFKCWIIDHYFRIYSGEINGWETIEIADEFFIFAQSCAAEDPSRGPVAFIRADRNPWGRAAWDHCGYNISALTTVQRR
jgi:hypothetical protein